MKRRIWMSVLLGVLVAITLMACVQPAPGVQVKEEVVKEQEGLALINWNEPRPMVERLTNQGRAEVIGPELVEEIKKRADGRDMSGRTAMLDGYILPEGWQEATKGVTKLVATNGGGLFHDPATVLGAILFEEMTGIKIEFKPMACRDLPPKHTTMFAAKSSAIDLVYSCASYLDVPIWAASGWLEPMDFLWSPEVRELYVPGLADAFRGPDGHFYGSPHIALHSWYLYYRPSWLEGAGVEVPETWQELVVASRKVDEWAKENVGPEVAGLSHPAVERTVVEHLWAHPTYAKGETIMQDGRAVIDPEVWQLLVDLFRKGGMTPAAFEQSWADTPEAFAKGRLGFAPTWETYLDLFSDPEFAPTIQGDWAVAPMPAWEGVGVMGRAGVRIDGFFVNKFSSPQEKAAAMLFVDFYRSFQGSFNELVFEGNDAIMPAVAEHPAATKSPVLPEKYLDVRMQALNNQSLETFPPAIGEVLDIFKEFLEKAALGDMDPDQAREEAQKALDEILVVK